MRGLSSPSSDSPFSALSPMIRDLDSLYWIVDCQSGPVNSLWIDEAEENEHVFEDMHVDVPAFTSTSTRLWRPGSIAQVGHVLFFDEWSYFVGFHSPESDAVARATRLGFPSCTPDFYAALECEGELFMVHVDGWWEIYPARAALFCEIQSLTSWREIPPSEY